MRNKVNNRRKFEEKQFKVEKVHSSLDSPTNTWKTAKSFMNFENSAGPPCQLCIGGVLITKAVEIASEMNSFFISKVMLIREGIAYLPNTFNKCLEIMQNKRCKLALTHVSVSKINRLLKKLKSSRSSSIDELDSYCVKIAADVIAEPLHHVICLSIIQHKFPTSWKYSKLIPLHKKDSKLQAKNYRPVAILSPFSKILEKIAYEQIYNYFTRNKLFHPDLHGYRQHRSTQTALITMYDRWVKAAMKGQVSGVILLDLSAAFDLVEPDLLVQKLKIYGLDDDYLAWVHSYLSGRFQAVWIGHILSDFLKCDVGVPQGSNLGPLFFLIFFNDLPGTLACDVDSYADDTTLSATGKSVDEIGEQLTKDCEAVSTWMRANKLKLNPVKTHILTMGTQQRLNILPKTVQVSMDGIQLQEDEGGCEVLLGCKMQTNLKWQNQVDFLLKKLRTRLAGLMCIKYLVPFEVRNIITQGIFNSILVYCLPLYGGCDVGQMKDIQVLQNKAAQIVCHAPPRANRAAMFDRLGWMTVHQLVCYHSLITLFKIRSSGEPEYLSHVVRRDNVYGRIIIPNTELGLAKKSFTLRTSLQWNLLPASLRSTARIGMFKIALKKWIKCNIQRFID